jgi:glucan phosphoethanolaminetransferase (alkaline phosphatase superfamily)
MASQTMAEALSLPSARSTSSSRPGWAGHKVGGALLALPGVAIALLDWTARHDQIVTWPRTTLASYAATLVLGAVVWGALLAASAAPHAWVARALLVFGAGLAVGAQVYYFGRYHAYMNPRAVLVGTSMMPSVGQQLWSDRTSFAGAVVPPILLAFGLATVLRRTGFIDPARARLALDVALAAVLFAVFAVEVGRGGGEQAAAPDVLYFASIGKLASAHWRHDEAVESAHPGTRTPAPVPVMAALGNRRSLLFVITESVRAYDACSVPTDDCKTTPFTNRLLPSRFGFSQMRALDSTTAASLAVLWSGLAPTSSREALHTAPLIWEYAHAAGFDTAYWTSQNLLFANAGTWLEGVPLSRWVSATDLDSDPSYEVGADDGKLVDVVLGDLPGMHAPFVGVVHMSNTHFPYLIDESDAPFQPQARAFGKGDTVKVRNRYRDAVHRQDAIVARLVRGLRAMPGGDGVVIAFVSDHGEQVRERGAVGHTWGVYDEEVRVPFWIDVPAGALSDAQAVQLNTLRDTPLTQLDVLPTLLDLMGIWDALEVLPLRRPMPGDSLLRGGTPGRAAVLTNCSSIFSCASKNWGAMRRFKKVAATQNDSEWSCFDLSRDPEERVNLGAEACGDLAEIAEAEGRGTPF